MSNQDVVDFVAQNRNKKNIANLLTQEAYDKGSTDNISVIIKFFNTINNIVVIRILPSFNSYGTHLLKVSLYQHFTDISLSYL